MDYYKKYVKYKSKYFLTIGEDKKFVNLRRRIEITASKTEISKIKKIIKTLVTEFNKRNVDIKYVSGSPFKAELYGYDGQLKKTIMEIDKIKDFIIVIDNMPMGYIEKKNREG
jgi:hypothetical protein